MVIYQVQEEGATLESRFHTLISTKKKMNGFIPWCHRNNHLNRAERHSFKKQILNKLDGILFKCNTLIAIVVKGGVEKLI